ncbi:putative DNA polymerase [Oscillibacter valericigenes Sjm18-20]|nr:putative DNA polymerase [Oscillibacter valericigenes Sjm18-20]
MDAFAKGEDIYCATASQMFHVPVVKHSVNSELRQKGKVAELACGYGGSVGALKAMGALEMGLKESELQPIVNSWRGANPNIVKFWWAVDRAAKAAIKGKTSTSAYGITFSYESGFLFIRLPSGRRLAYVKPRIGENRFGGEAITYEGTGGTKKWERLETYGPKLTENIIQATSRDILCHAMRTLRSCDIVAHVHDEVIIEADRGMSLAAVCEQMGRTPSWASGLMLRADGYECDFYKKD